MSLCYLEYISWHMMIFFYKHHRSIEDGLASKENYYRRLHFNVHTAQLPLLLFEYQSMHVAYYVQNLLNLEQKRQFFIEEIVKILLHF